MMSLQRHDGTRSRAGRSPGMFGSPRMTTATQQRRSEAFLIPDSALCQPCTGKKSKLQMTMEAISMLGGSGAVHHAGGRIWFQCWPCLCIVIMTRGH